MAIQLSDIAASRVQHFLENRGKGIGLRLGVKTTGCSGLAYVIEFVDELQEGDEVFETKGVKVIVDKKSSLYLDGTTVDFYEGIDKRGFTFENPNAVKSCSCGSSFQA